MDKTLITNTSPTPYYNQWHIKPSCHTHLMITFPTKIKGQIHILNQIHFCDIMERYLNTNSLKSITFCMSYLIQWIVNQNINRIHVFYIISILQNSFMKSQSWNFDLYNVLTMFYQSQKYYENSFQPIKADVNQS